MNTYLLHYVASLWVVERITRSHVIVSIVSSKYEETSVFIFIKFSTVVKLATSSAATRRVARDRRSLLAFHSDESQNDNVIVKEEEAS